MAADVVGYSRLMGADEEGTFSQLKGHRRDLVDPKIKEHRGRIVKTSGDGVLVEFVSPVEAVRCAVEVQRGMVTRSSEVPQDKRIIFRMGINLGDVIAEKGDLFGDGVCGSPPRKPLRAGGAQPSLARCETRSGINCLSFSKTPGSMRSRTLPVRCDSISSPQPRLRPCPRAC